MPSQPSVTVSIVSHHQGDLLSLLLRDLQAHCPESIEVIVTLNTAESLPFGRSDFDFPLQIVRNRSPKGFAANHNSAFTNHGGDFFCVMNPDLGLTGDPFPALTACFQEEGVGVAAPLIVNEAGEIEDSARRFPTPIRLLAKLLGRPKKPDYVIQSEPIRPDWVAGMFMMFSSRCFREMGGFDARYFLYYEDVDMCARLRLAGYDAVLCPSVVVAHDARRQSHHSLKYMRWHLLSIFRFFRSDVYRRTMAGMGARPHSAEARRERR